MVEVLSTPHMKHKTRSAGLFALAVALMSASLREAVEDFVDHALVGARELVDVFETLLNVSVGPRLAFYANVGNRPLSGQWPELRDRRQWVASRPTDELVNQRPFRSSEGEFRFLRSGR